MVPSAASASWTASANAIPRLRSWESNTRLSAKVSRSTGTWSFFAAWSERIWRARSAACNAAFPVMSVTRLE